jgi:signal transduction histidine kinase
VLTIALLIFSTRITSTTLDRNNTSKEGLASIKVQTGLAHVWLEEGLGGDRKIDFAREVDANLAGALGTCFTLRRAESLPALAALCARLGELRTLADQRWHQRAASRPGSTPDQEYDRAFTSSMRLADEAQHALTKKIVHARTTVNRINAGIVFGVFLIFGGMTLVVGRRIRQLAAYNERLRRVDVVKDNLMASVSHELRTPLTSTIGFLKTVERSDVDLDEDSRRELITIARVQAERLARLVDDLLFFAQIENGGIRLAREDVDVASLAEECIRAMQPHARSKGVALRLIAEPSRLRGDRARLAQLLDNLISNAIKFTRPGGRVDILALSGDGEVQLEISDNGIGIAAADRPQLFDRFFRSESAVENAIAGTGLGLPIVKAIVDAHDGEISIESEEGRGTTVVVRLPAVLDAYRRPVPARTRSSERLGRAAP